MNRTPLTCTLLLLLLASTVFSQKPEKGNEFRGWEEMETEHFRIIYEPRDTISAERVIEFCEPVYRIIAEFFDSYPEKIPCILRGRIDTANGFFSSLPSHIELFITAPTTPWIGVSHQDWLKILFIHELVHYIHSHYNHGLFYGLSTVFGEAVRASLMAFMPGWMTEGIAVYLETALTEGGRGRNPFFEIYYKALIIEDSLFSLRQSSYGSPFPPPGRIYVAGHLIIDYMTRRFGSEVLGKIHRRFSKFPLFGPRAAIKAVTGVSARSIFEGMKQELEQRYRDTSAIPDGKRMSPAVTGNYYLPVSTDNGLYLYRRTLEKTPAIVHFDPETSQETVIAETALTDYTSFSLNQDGSSLIIAAGESNYLHPAGRSFTSDLYRIDPGTGTRERITEHAHLWQPVLSPDGARLIAVERVGQFSRLVAVDQDTGTIGAVFEENETNVYNPTFSPDGRSVCFAFNDAGRQTLLVLDVEPFFSAAAGEREILGEDSATVLRLEGSKPLPGVQHTPGVFFPRFSDNETILFSSAIEGSLALYTWSIPTGTIKRVCRDPVGVLAGIPYEGKILYQSYSSDGYVLKVKEAETSRGTATAVNALLTNTISSTGPSGITGGEQNSPTPKRYIDAPLPLYWLPLPLYVNPFSPLTLTVGAGAYLFGNSLLGNMSWDATITSRIDLFQPGIRLSLYGNMSPLILHYSLLQGYTSVPGIASYQQTQQTLQIQLPIVNSVLLSTQTSLSVTAGVTHQFQLSGQTPFHLGGIGSQTTLSSEHRLSFLAGLSLLVSKAKPPKPVHRPSALSVDLNGYIPIPLERGQPSGAGAYLQSSLSIPSFIKNQVVKFGVKANYYSADLLHSSASFNSITPRGSFSPTVKQQEGRALIALDYGITFALLDLPLPIGYNMFGFNLQGIGGGVHAETILDWSVMNPAFHWDDNIYIGIELTAVVGTTYSSIPVGIGCSFRFDRRFSRAVVPAEDFGFYVFVGTDSFDAAIPGRTPRSSAPPPNGSTPRSSGSMSGARTTGPTGPMPGARTIWAGGRKYDARTTGLSAPLLDGSFRKPDPPPLHGSSARPDPPPLHGSPGDVK